MTTNMDDLRIAGEVLAWAGRPELVSCIADAFAEIKASRERDASGNGGWEAMETAPSDGTEIDVWCGCDGRLTVHWDRENNRWSSPDGMRFWSRGWFSYWRSHPRPPRRETPALGIEAA